MADTRWAAAKDERGRSFGAVAADYAAELRAEVTAHTTRWVHRVPPDAVVGRAASSSRIALLDEAGRRDYLGRIRELLATHPRPGGATGVEVTYLTNSWRLTPR